MTKFLGLLSLSALVAMVSFQASPVTALVAEPHVARHAGHHAAIASKKRRSATCKPRIPTASATSTTEASSSAAYVAPTSSAWSAPASSSAPAWSSSAAPPPASSAWSAPPTSSSSSGGNGGGNSGGGSSSGKKVGIAWANGDSDNLQNFVTDKTQFLYTWGPSLPSNLYGLTGVPMLWGYDQTNEFASTVTAGYSTHVLGMNEPNEVGQSNMTPEEGAALWKQYIDPLKNQGYTLISPAPSSRPNGFDWVGQFLGNCTGCQVDRIALHYYDITTEGFIDWVTKFHDAYGKDIWVTEFADQNFNGPQQQSQDEVNSFMSTVTSWMDNTPWVEQYFAFGIMEQMAGGVSSANQLMTSSGQPTALGYQYIYG